MNTVLLVEDEPWQALLFERQLANYRVHHAHNGYEAIQFVDEHIPDVILLDMLLPGATALSLIHELKSHDDLAPIPIIIMSTIADSLKQSSLEAYGVAEVLDKTSMAHGDITRAVERALA